MIDKSKFIEVIKKNLKAFLILLWNYLFKITKLVFVCLRDNLDSQQKIWLFFYRLVLVLILPLLVIILIYRLILRKEDPLRIFERFGFASQNVKKSKIADLQLIWINAVSVGEANTALILAEELLKFSKCQILITTTTLTSSQVVEKKILYHQGKIIHQFLPLDVDFFVKKFLNFWQPRAIIFIESDIWPNFLATARARAINVFLVNARISYKSLKSWQKLKKLGFNIFDYFSTIIAQSKEEQIKIQSLTSSNVLFYGNLKAQLNNSLDIPNDILEQLKNQINNRPIWLCASTHRGEEQIIINIHDKLLKDFPDLLTIIVLRHPIRIKEVHDLVGNLKYATRSLNQFIDQQTSLYLVDTLNELAIFYNLADFAFIGGSLFAIGGHNPFEAIKQNCAVISGEGVANFAEIYQELFENKSAIIVKNKTELYLTVKDFLSGKKIAQDYAKKASKILVQNQGVSERIVLKIAEIIPLSNN